MEKQRITNLVMAFYEALNRHGDLGLLTQSLAPAWVVHPPLPGGGTDTERYAAAIQPIFQALPDFHITVEQVLVEEDWVAVRGHVTGTHVGGLFGVPGTGRAISYATQDMHRLHSGQIVESWHVEDWLGVLVQIGALPLPAAAST